MNVSFNQLINLEEIERNPFIFEKLESDYSLNLEIKYQVLKVEICDTCGDGKRQKNENCDDGWPLEGCLDDCSGS